MNIKLRKINKHNFHLVNDLEVTEEQKKFVSNPYFAIAQSKYERWIKTSAIYLDKIIIGFIEYGFDPNLKSYWIKELIIDKKYQNKGYGKTAVEQLLKILKEKHNYEIVYAGYKPNNFNSKKLCESLGFKETDIFTEKHIVIFKELL